MKVLFIYPHIGDGLRRSPETRRYFPWGPATVLRALQEDGHAVEVIDVYGNDSLPAEVEQRLEGCAPDCVCLSGFASYNYGYVLWLAAAVKRRFAVPVIVGGILADLHHELLLAKGTIDVCVLGEGEVTAVELLRRLESPGQVPGVAWRDRGRVRVTDRRPVIADLDALPMPDFGLWNMEPYLRSNLWADDETTRYDAFGAGMPARALLHPNIAMFFGRGCPFKCAFCSRSYQTVRYKSVDRVIEEIRFLKKTFGVRAIHFYDELVVFKRGLVLELCRKIKPLGVFWDCQGRVNTVDRELMRAMRDAGCYSIGFGFESGSDAMLRAMRKGVTRAQNLEVLEAARKEGLHLKIQLMAGYPGETAATMAETVSMMKRSGLPPRRMSWTTPLPGSSIYEDARTAGLIPDEETYLLRLGRTPMNGPGAIVLNVSGLPDTGMEQLFLKTQAVMDLNHALARLRARPFRRASWRGLPGLLRRRLAGVGWLRSLYHRLRPRPASATTAATTSR